MKRAIVIGATSGIGRALAERLAAAGYAVGAVGRREHLLRQFVTEFPACRFAAADVSRTDALPAVLERLAGELGGMDLCIVAAGAGELNPALDFALEEPAIRTNVAGWTAAVDWAWVRLERQGGGALAVVTSVGGLRGSPSAPAYAASKAYQIAYAEALRMRAAKAGLPIRITDVRPGLVATRMARGEGLFWVMPVDRVATQILRAVRCGRSVAVVTRRWRIVAWLLRLLPASLLRRVL